MQVYKQSKFTSKSIGINVTFRDLLDSSIQSKIGKVVKVFISKTQANNYKLRVIMCVIVREIFKFQFKENR
ncbi:unnamed protein product [Paramecium sonneborni]|uniref:Uncharacterized protein n=1 Tax=Paramecium sonneborni TaxID=65129 RepID=A0A8S1QY39_9CILI|nr:unnamed protein product [Paramecium sonneborni]